MIDKRIKGLGILILIALISLISLPITFAANDPGHDTLYVELIGDVMTGFLNVTSTIYATQNITTGQRFIENTASFKGVSTEELVLNMHFDDGSGTTVTDWSGYNNHGTVYEAVWNTSGKFGTAMTFDGLNDHVNATVNFNIDNITIEAWFKTIDNTTNQVMVGGSDGSIFWLSGGNRLRMSDGGFNSLTSPANFINNNQWYHGVLTREKSGNQTLYLDGVEVAKNAAKNTTLSWTKVIIGYWINTGDRFFNGTIDSIAIYNTVLTADEILSHYLRESELKSIYDNIYIRGNLTVGDNINISGTYYGDGSGLTNVPAGSVTDVWVNESGDIMTGTLNISTGNLSVEGVLFVDAQNNRVGIGTTSPGSYEDGKNNLVIFDSADVGMTIATSDSTKTGSIFFAEGTTGSTDDIGQIRYNFNNNIMTFRTNRNERVHISSSGIQILSSGVLKVEGTGDSYFQGNLGIGTADPDAKLHINGTGVLLNISNASASFLFVDQTTGRVGIGTASPSGGLHIISSINQFLIGDSTDTAPTFDLRQGGSLKGRLAYPGTNYITSVGLSDSFVLGSEGTLQFGVGGGTHAMTILTSGNVGIGTSTPANILHVNGTVRFEGQLNMTGNKIIELGEPTVGADATTKTYVDAQVGGGGSSGWNDTGVIVKLVTTTDSVNATNLFINNSLQGNTMFINGSAVGIGTTGPVSKLDIRGNVIIGVGTGDAQHSDLEIFDDDNTAYDATDLGYQRKISTLRITNKDNTAESFSQLLLLNSDTATSGARIVAIRKGSDASDLAFTIENNADKQFEAMRIDSSGNIGIGTITPTAKLHINGTGALLNISNATDSFLFVDQSTGRVGIGTSSPSGTLSIKEIGNAELRLHSFGPNTDGTIVFQEGSNAVGQDDSFVIKYDGTNNELSFDSPASSLTGIMVIERTGKVGIGTSSPTQVLQVIGNVSAAARLIENTTTFRGISTEGIVLNIHFDDGSGTTVTDWSGYNNHGAVSGASWNKTVSRFGTAMTFDGVDDFINTSTDMIGTGADSICAWIYPITAGEGFFGSIIHNNKTIFQTVDSSGDAIISFSSDGRVTTVSTSTGLITFSQWNHVCVTRNSSGTDTNIYVNGLLSKTGDSGTPATGEAVLIGSRADGARTFDGTIDSVAIYSRALTADEILSNYLRESELKSIYDNQYVRGNFTIRGDLNVSGDVNISGTYYGNGSGLINVPGSADVYVNESGDVMTGNLNMSGNNITNIGSLKAGNAIFNTNKIGFGGSSRPSMHFGAATATSPNIHPRESDLDTGIGSGAADALSLIAGGIEAIRINETGGNANVSIDTDTLFVDATDNRVGIGTSSPSFKLDVDGDLALNKTSTNQLILPLSNDATTPTLAFGDGNTGFYESADNNLRVSIKGESKWLWKGNLFEGGLGTGTVQILNEVTNATNPVHVFTGDQDTGIGSAAANQLSLIAGATEMMRLSVGTVNISTGNLSIDGVENRIILPTNNDAATPTLAFGDGDTGIYEESDDLLKFSTQGNAGWQMAVTSKTFESTASGRRPQLTANTESSATVPVYRFTGDTDTGIGSSGANQLSLIAGGVSGILINESGGNANITMDSGTLFVDATGNRVGIGTSSPSAGLQVGSGTAGHSPASDGIYVVGQSEFDGDTYFDGVIFAYSNLQARALLQIGTGSGDNTFSKVSDALHLGLGTALSSIITTVGNDGRNHDHGTQTNPTLFINSLTNPDDDNTEWLSMAYINATDYARIETGKGDIALMPAGNVGIGTTSPTQVLQVIGNVSAAARLIENTTTFKGVSTENLVLNMHFDDGTGTTVTDWSGYNNHGTVVGDSAWNISGKFGTAMEFDGVDDYINLGNATLLTSLNFTGELTLEAWIKTSGTSTAHLVGTEALFNGGSGSTGYHLRLYPMGSFGGTTGELKVGLEGGGNRSDDSNFWVNSPGGDGGSPINDGNWHHVVATINRTLITLYHDGIARGTISESNEIVFDMPTTNFSIGAELDADGSIAEDFNGTIDSVAIYSRALTPDEVLSNYLRESELKSIYDNQYIRGNLTIRGDLNVSGNVNISGTYYGDGSGITNLPAGSVDDVWVNESGDVMTGTLNITAANSLILASSNDATTPTLAFGDGDTGFYESADDTISISVGTTEVFQIVGVEFRSATSNGASMLNEVPSSTNPVFGFQADPDTGMSRASADNLSLIAGGVEGMRIIESTSDSVYFPLNVGIGTTSPNDKLEIAGNTIIRNAQNNPALIISPSNGGYGVDSELVMQASETGAGTDSPFHISRNALFQTSDDTYQYIDDVGDEASKLEFLNDGDIKFSYAASGTGTITWTDIMFIDGSAGNVGIGTIIPDQKLKVAGSVNITGIYYGDGSGLTNLPAGAVDDVWVNESGDVMTGTLNITAANSLILAASNDAGTPTLAFGDGDTGFYQNVDGTVSFADNGVKEWDIGGGELTSGAISANNAAGAMISNEGASTTNPTLHARRDDFDTGVGSGGADQLSLIAGGVEGLRVIEAASDVIYIPLDVGIGTTSPDDKLDVHGGAEFVDTGGFTSFNVSGSNGDSVIPAFVFYNTGDGNTFRIRSTAIAANRETFEVLGGTTGTTSYFLIDGAGNVTVDSGTLYVDATKGRVGIGTTNPAYNLVVGDGTGTTDSHILADGRFADPIYTTHGRIIFNDKNFGIGAGGFATSGSDDDLYIWAFDGAGRDIRFMETTDGDSNPNETSVWTTNMIIKNGGNIGIGTIIPDQKLKVAGSVNITGIYYGDGSGLTNLPAGAVDDVWVNESGDVMTGQLTITATGTAISADGNIALTGSGDDITFAGGTISDSVDGVDIADNLEVAGTTQSQQYFSDTTNEETVSGTYTATKMVYRFSEGRGIGYNLADDRIFFAMNEGVPMVIDNSGNVGIGITNPAYRLEVADTGAKTAVNLSGVLFVDASANKVGIGNTTPFGFLHIYQATVNTGTPNLALEQNGTGDPTLKWLLTGGSTYTMGIDNSAGDNLKIGYHATSRSEAVSTGTIFDIDSSGNLGIEGNIFDIGGTTLVVNDDLQINGDNLDSSGAPLVINNIANQAVYIGSGTGGVANGDNDFYVTGDAEVDGILYLDAVSTALNSDGDIVLTGSGDDFILNGGNIHDNTGNLLLIDTVDIGSSSTGLRITTDGVINDLDDASVVINDDLTVQGGDIIITSNSGGVDFNDASAFWLKTATNWGLYWNTTPNTLEFRGSGVNRAEIDLDNGNFQTDGDITVTGGDINDASGAWLEVSSCGTGSTLTSVNSAGTLTCSSIAISNTQITDVWVNESGDTMTGQLTITATGTAISSDGDIVLTGAGDNIAFTSSGGITLTGGTISDATDGVDIADAMEVTGLITALATGTAISADGNIALTGSGDDITFAGGTISDSVDGVDIADAMEVTGLITALATGTAISADGNIALTGSGDDITFAGGTISDSVDGVDIADDLDVAGTVTITQTGNARSLGITSDATTANVFTLSTGNTGDNVVQWINDADHAGGNLFYLREENITTIANVTVIDNYGLGDSFVVRELTVTRFVIRNGGNVGIGTGLPSANLHIGPVDTASNAGDELLIVDDTPQIAFEDNTASADDFWIHINSNNFYVLADRADDGNWETPHPLQLEADTNIGYLFGNQITTENIDSEGVTSIATTSPITGGTITSTGTIGITVAKDIVAGNGLTGGEDNVLPGADADTTLAVGAGNCITIGADTVGVGSLCIDDAEIVQDSIDATEIAPDAITNSELAANSVDLTSDALSTAYAGSGLGGGGTAALNVGAGSGITVNANDVQLERDHIDRINYSSARSQSQISGGGTITWTTGTSTLSWGTRFIWIPVDKTVAVNGHYQLDASSAVLSDWEGLYARCDATNVCAAEERLYSNANQDMDNWFLVAYRNGDLGRIIFADGTTMLDTSTTTITGLGEFSGDITGTFSSAQITADAVTNIELAANAVDLTSDALSTAYAGSGLGGGGTAALNVGGGTCITANANDVAVTADCIDDAQIVNNGIDAGSLAPNSVAASEFNEADASLENEVEAMIFDTDAESITGVWEVQDDVNFQFGTVAEWSINYDDSVDDQLLFTTTKTAAITTSDPLLQILVGTTPSANQQVFGVAKGTQATNTDLLTLDEDGDAVFLGDLTITGGDILTGTIRFGTTASSGRYEFEDAGVCIGSGGCTASATDGDLLVEGDLTMSGEQGGIFSANAVDLNPSFALQYDGSDRIWWDQSPSYFVIGELVGAVNVGIGTTAPLSDLTIYGGFCIDDDATCSNIGNGDMAILDGGICVESDGACVPPADGTVRARVHSTGASDLAEDYRSLETLEPGDVVIFDREKAGFIRKSTKRYEQMIAGVVSTSPGFILGIDVDSWDENGTFPDDVYPVALSGKVPTKVTNENGKIKPGDLLTSSSVPGVAMRATETEKGSIIGIALGPFNGESGIIEIFISVTYGLSVDEYVDKYYDVKDNIVEELEADGKITAEEKAEIKERIKNLKAKRGLLPVSEVDAITTIVQANITTEFINAEENKDIIIDASTGGGDVIIRLG